MAEIVISLAGRQYRQRHPYRIKASFPDLPPAYRYYETIEALAMDFHAFRIEISKVAEQGGVSVLEADGTIRQYH